MVIRHGPDDGPGAIEGLRMAVGQSISNRVTVVLVDAGVRVIGSLESDPSRTEEARKHLGMLARLKQRVWTERESLESHGMDASQLPDEVSAVWRREIDEELLVSEAVVVY